MSADHGELERTLGFLEAMTLGGGTMIGAGIFILPGIAAESAGPASAISYAIAGFVALLAALSLSELATGMPIAGGSYHYVNRALGAFFGSIVGWGMWTGLIFASAFYMVGFGQYLVEPIPGLDGRAMVVLLGLLGLALLVGVNYYGTEESSRLQNLMIGAETAVIIVFVAVGVLFIEPANLEPFAPRGAAGVVATTGIVFISFLGFEIIATVAGEIKDPGRIIPRSMLLSVVLVTGLYVLVMLVSTGVVPYETFADSAIPVADVAVVYLGSAGVVAIVAAAVIAAISSSNSSVLAASRVIYAMGRDGVVADWFNASHPRFFTPHRAILATGGVTAMLVSLGLGVDEIIALLAEAASFSFLVTYSLVHVSLVVFRRADPDEYDPDFALPFPVYPAVPALGVVLSVVVITQMAPVIVALGTGIVVLGVVWYLAYARTRVVGEGLLREALRPEPPRRYRVVVPVANPETQGGLLRLAAASARANAERGAPELVVVNVVEGPRDAPLQNLEAERVDHQRALLAHAHDVAEREGVDLRTRAVVAPDAAEALLEVAADEAPDELLLGWSGALGEGPTTFGDTLDAVLAGVDADVALVRLRDDDVGRPVGLVGPGPNAPAVARRVAEFAAVDDAVPRLVTVVAPSGDDEATDEARGRDRLSAAAAAADLEDGAFDAEVVVADDLEAAVGDLVAGAATVVAGLAERAGPGPAEYGDVTEVVADHAGGNLALVRAGTSPGDRADVT